MSSTSHSNPTGMAAVPYGTPGRFDAFAPFPSRDEQVRPMYTGNIVGASSSSYVHPYSSAMSASASATLSLFDETATQWLARDATHQLAPPQIKHMQASVHLWKMMPACDTGATGSNSNSIVGDFGGMQVDANTVPAARVQTKFADPKIHAGEVVELYGRSGCGKTELMYQCVLHAIMPKSFTAPELGCPIVLGGLDSGVAYLDLDYRFSMTRLEQLLQERIRSGANDSVRTALMHKIHQQQPELDRASLETEAQEQCDALLVAFFDSSYYSTLTRHLWSNIMIYHAQTPRQALVALIELEDMLRDFGTKTAKMTWREKERKREEKERKEITNQEAQQDVEMKTSDIDDLLYDPSVSAASVAAAKNSSSKESPPNRMAMLLIDNTAAFYWQTKPQGVGYASIAANLYSKERAAVGAGVVRDQDGTNEKRTADKDNSWFAELLTHRVRYLLNQYHLIGILSKPTISHKNNLEVRMSLHHNEFLGLTYNSLITYRIVIREDPEPQDLSAESRRKYVHGSVEEQKQRELIAARMERGVLRGASLKSVKVVNGAVDSSTMEFQFRIGAKGIKPERIIHH